MRLITHSSFKYRRRTQSILYLAVSETVISRVEAFAHLASSEVSLF
jgi:hypothetical protein